MLENQPTTGQQTLITILLLCVILIGGGARLYNPLWDLGTFPHPDERSTLLFYATQIRFPENKADTLDPRQSTLNPFWNAQTQERRSYTYGHFPLYSLVLTSAFLEQLAPLAASINVPPEVVDFLGRATTGHGYTVVGRILVALFDTLSIYLVFLIGRRLYGAWAGLLAATLSALAVLHIQLAHFFAVDPISTTFVLLAIYGSLLIFDRRTAGSAFLAGLAIGLAVSSKYSALPIVLVPATAGLFIIKDAHQAKDSGIGAAFRLIGITALTAFITFALTSPFVFLDWANFYRAVVEEQGDMVSGLADFPFTRQYRGTTPYLYFIEQQIKWGLGWPLGLLAFAGLAWALIRVLSNGLRPGEWLILAWLVPYFGLTGLFLAKFIRYMSPVTPLIIILGVGMLVMLARRLSQIWSGARWLVSSLAAIILIGTAFWAAAFVNGVYAAEHSWVTASRWIYANVPDGSCVAREHWEEGVPRDWAWREPGMSPGNHSYYQPQLPMYDPDTPQKYEIIRDTLRQCDYLVIASNRMLRTLPRLSERYPMSTAYYQALFAGELGYELVFEAETPPRLGSIVIDDQPADESFTVYDHPKAFIFKKTRDLSDTAWLDLLGNTWQGAIHGYIGEPTLLMKLRGAASGPSLNIEEVGGAEEQTTWLQKPLAEWPALSDWRWNNLANDNPVIAVLVWLLAIQIIGVFAFSITFLLFTRLVDKGYLFAKSLGLLLISYVVWLLASLGLPANQLIVILSSLLVMGAISLGLALRHKSKIGLEIYRAWWRHQWPYLLLGEVTFIAVFILFTTFRFANPDLWQPWNGGEKMLEIGFLNAIVKSAYMPPYDPFFAGTFINYYYYGLYIVGVMVKLTGIEPTIAFNLAVPMLAALTAANVFGLAVNLARSRERSSPMRSIIAGLLAVFCVLFFSNLDGMGQFLRNLAEISQSDFTSAIPGLETLVRAGFGFVNALQGTAVRQYDYWAVSRVIPTTINEFPYWSFLFADLHPHMIGIPFTVLFLGLVYAWLKGSPSAAQSPTTAGGGAQTGQPPERQTFSQNATIGPGTFAYEADLPTEGVIYSPSAESSPKFWTELWQTIVGESLDLRHHISAGTILRWLALPFILGALVVINVWDLPTYAGLICAAFALSRYRAGLRPLTLAKGIVLAIEMVGFTALLLGATLLLYRPFFTSYVPLVSGLGLVRDKIPFDEFFKLWGFFLLIIVTWLAWQLYRPRTGFAPLRAFSLFVRRWNVFPHLVEIYRALVFRTRSEYELALVGIGLVLILTVVLMAFQYIVVALLMPCLLIALLLLLRWEVSPEQSFIELLVFTGLLVLLGVQFVFLEDWLGGGDYYRMNTFFKFFIQVWVMFGLTTGIMLPILWNRAEQWSWGWRWSWQLLVSLFVFSSMVFFVLGTPQRNDNRFPEARPASAGLDGMAYMTVGTFEFEYPYGSRTFNRVELNYDYEAIHWLQDNVSGTPIIAEAQIGYYREAGMRVAAYTGLPTILGKLHQNEQHPSQQLGERDGLVRQFWNELDPARFMALAQELKVDYIYFGQLERIVYGEQHLQKFEQLVQQELLELVYENEKTKIYRVLKKSGS